MLLGCAPERISLRTRFHVNKLMYKQSYREHSDPYCKESGRDDCKKEWVTVYEDDNGDIGITNLPMFALVVDVDLRSTGAKLAKPGSYIVALSYSTYLFRLGNVGASDAFLAALYFVIFATVFRSELQALVLLPYSIWKLMRCHSCSFDWGGGGMRIRRLTGEP